MYELFRRDATKRSFIKNENVFLLSAKVKAIVKERHQVPPGTQWWVTGTNGYSKQAHCGEKIKNSRSDKYRIDDASLQR